MADRISLARRFPSVPSGQRTGPDGQPEESSNRTAKRDSGQCRSRERTNASKSPSNTGLRSGCRAREKQRVAGIDLDLPKMSDLPDFPVLGEVARQSCPKTRWITSSQMGSGARLIARAGPIGRHRESFSGMDAGRRRRDNAAACGKASRGSCARDGARSISGGSSS